jgi:hypothetical protein
MNSFFSFDPSKVLFNIQLAMSYTPRILENRITHRPYNGFLFVVRGAYTYSSQGESFTAHAGELIYLPAGSVPYSYFISDAGNGSVQTLQIEFALTDARSGSPLSFSDHPILVSTIDKSSVKYAMKSVIAAHSRRLYCLFFGRIHPGLKIRRFIYSQNFRGRFGGFVY